MSGHRETECQLLVDFENVQNINLTSLPDHFSVTVFVGNAQKSLPFTLVEAAQKLGDRLEWKRVDGAGSNALDFHIAYYIGCLLTQCPRTRCIILSKDTGFDPLLRHLKQKGLNCRRINSLLDLVPQKVPDANSTYVKVLENLEKMPKNRPRQREALTRHVATLAGKSLPEQEVAALVERLFLEGKVKESDGKLFYTF